MIRRFRDWLNDYKMKDKLRLLRRYWSVLLLITLPIGITWVSYRTTLRVQEQRLQYERFLYRALETCQSGNFTGAYTLLVRARSYAPTEAESDFAREMMPKFRMGDCNMPIAPKPGDVELDLATAP